MKGKIILRTLCAGLILASVVGCAGGTTSSTSISEATSSESSVIKYYGVSTTLKGTGAYLDVDVTSAKKGQTVQLTVVLTDENYEVDTVKVGDKTVSGSTSSLNSRIRYYLYTVGEEDVNFVVTTYDTVAAKSHSISYNDENGLSHADGLATRKDAGEEVSFTIGTVSGYSVEGLEIYYMDGEDKVDVDYSGNSVTGYKFTMPDANVIIEPTVLGAYFKADFDTEVVGSITGSYNTKDYTTQDFIYKMYVENGTDDEGNSVWEESSTFFARAGQKCAFARKHNNQLRLKDFVINGETVEADETPVVEGYETYSFVMGNINSTVKAEVVDASKEAIVELSAAEVTHLDVELFTIDETVAEDETKTYTKRPFDGKWKYGETIYVSASSKEGFSEYQPNSIKATKTAYSTTYGAVATASDTTEYAWGYSSSWADFTTEDISAKLPDYVGKTVMKYTPNANYTYSKIEVVVSEKNMEAYKNAAIVKAGNFYGGNAYSFSGSVASPSAKSFSGSTPIFASSDGNVTVGTGVKDSLPEGYDGSNALFEGTKGFKMFYDGGSVMAITYSATGSLTGDMYIGTNKISESDKANAKVKTLSTISGTTGAVLFGFYNGTTLVDQCLAYYVDGTLHMNSKVTIVTADEDPFVTNANVTVKGEDGTTLYSFNEGSSTTGGDSSSSADLTSLAGNYECGNDVYFNINVEGSTQEITYMDTSNGTEVTVTFTYNASTKKGSFGTIGDWDGNNYFTVNDNGTITFHLEDGYLENVANKTGTKMA